jgi:hypothetical protein
MNHTFLIVLAFASICLLGACGGNDSDHGHPHDDAAPAPHAAESSGDDAEHGHTHGEDTHSHDGPETEAYYGDDAASATEDAVVDDTGHAHGSGTHTHNGDEEGADNTPGDGEGESVEPHGHDH